MSKQVSGAEMREHDGCRYDGVVTTGAYDGAGVNPHDDDTTAKSNYDNDARINDDNGAVQNTKNACKKEKDTKAGKQDLMAKLAATKGKLAAAREAGRALFQVVQEAEAKVADTQAQVADALAQVAAAQALVAAVTEERDRTAAQLTKLHAVADELAVHAVADATCIHALDVMGMKTAQAAVAHQNAAAAQQAVAAAQQELTGATAAYKALRAIRVDADVASKKRKIAALPAADQAYKKYLAKLQAAQAQAP